MDIYFFIGFPLCMIMGMYFSYLYGKKKGIIEGRNEMKLQMKMPEDITLHPEYRRGYNESIEKHRVQLERIKHNIHR